MTTSRRTRKGRSAVSTLGAPKPRLRLAVPSSRRAEVVLDLELTHDRAELVLTNCGDAVATDVSVRFSRLLLGLGGSVDISSLPVFERLGVLTPGRSLRIFWDGASALFAHDQGSPFVATVAWSERFRPRQRVEYRHDPGIYRRLPTCVAKTAPVP